MMDRSNTLLARAQSVIPGASQTLSKGPTQWTQLPFIVRGEGCHVWDADGNEYIDLPGALGPVILGYHYPAVNEAIKRQLDTGIIVSSTPHPLEAEVAEMLIDLIPCAEMVRFGKNGSDVTSAAVRLARAVTGREVVALGGYHGWQDWSMAHRYPWNDGIPLLNLHTSIPFQFNDLASLETAFIEARDNRWSSYRSSLAAVILEPITSEEPQPGYLQAVRDLCTKHGAVLIFDEVKTGFRVALGGAQELYGVTPDLACFGKAMANGMPISALVGKRALMQEFERVFFSTTFGGECLSLAAAKATIGELQSVPDFYKRLFQMGDHIAAWVEHTAHRMNLSDQLRPSGHCCKIQIMVKDLAVKTLIQQDMIKHGILWNGEHMLSWAYDDDDIRQVTNVYNTVLNRVLDALAIGDIAERIEGRQLTEVFRR